jgi:hypothetical protein
MIVMGDGVTTLDEVQAILRENPEYARIDDLIAPYYELMKVVITYPGVPEKDRFRIVALIEKLAQNVD